MKLVCKILLINAIFITINSEEVVSEDEDFTDDDEGKHSEEEYYYSDEYTSNESDKHADKDKHLQNYLGIDRGFVSNRITKNWCPETCEKEGQIYENPNLSSYCVCEQNGTNTLNTVHYNCAKHELYNSTVHGCHKLKGNGYATCVIRNKTCPSNKKGVFQHPNKDLYKNYIVCLDDKVIVAECNYMSYYNDTKKRCVRKSNKETVLSHSDCEEAPIIDCKEPGVTLLEDYLRHKNNSLEISENCKHCYYLCNDRDLFSYDLAIHCFQKKITNADTTTWDYISGYNNETTGVSKSTVTAQNLQDYRRVDILDKGTIHPELIISTTINLGGDRYETSATVGIVVEPLIIEPISTESANQPTTTISSTKQTTAAEIDETETSLKTTEVFESTTHFEEKSSATDEIQFGTTQKERPTTASILSQTPINLTRTPEATTKDWKKTKITIHDEQTVSEEVPASTTTATARTSSSATDASNPEVESTEEDKSTTTSMSTRQVQSEDATTIITGKIEDDIRPHTESTVFEELPGITLTISDDISSIVTEPEGLKLTDNGKDESETSTRIPEILIIEVIKLIEEHLQQHHETTTDFEGNSFVTDKTEIESTQKDNLTTAPVSSQKPTNLPRTPEITTKDWEKTKITIHDTQTVSEEVLGSTTTATTRTSSLATKITVSEVQSTEENKSTTTSILSTGQAHPEETTTIVAGKTEESDIRPHTDSTVYEELPGFTLTTSGSIVPGQGGMETTDNGRDETETSSSFREILYTVGIRGESTTYSELQSPITTNYSEEDSYKRTVTTEIVAKPSITEPTNADSAGRSTTSILSTRQTTARDTYEGETSRKITEVFETTTDFEGSSFVTAETEISPQKHNLTTVPVSLHTPTNQSKTPEIATKDMENTTTVSEEELGSTTTATIRTNLVTEIKISEVQPTEENKSTTTNTLSTVQVQPEDATTIVAGKTEEGDIRLHTDSTVYEELPGFTLTTSAEIRSVVTESGGMETTDNGRDGTETSSSIREILIIDAIKLIDEYLQEHPETVSLREESTTYSEIQSPITINYSEEGGYETNVTDEIMSKPLVIVSTNAESAGQSTTTIMSTRQITARDIEEGEAGTRITEVFEATTDFEGNSFVTEETELESIQKDNLTTAPTSEITTKDWEKIKTTIHDKQMVSEQVLGNTTTVTTRISSLATEITISEVQSIEDNKSSTTSILSTMQVQPEDTTTTDAGKTESDIRLHTDSTVYEELPRFTLTTSVEISSIVTESEGMETTDSGRDDTETSSSIPETISIREENTTYSEIQSPITINYSEEGGYEINVTAEIVSKPLVTASTNAESADQSTTTILSTRQTTARDTEEGEAGTRITEVFEATTDFEGNSFVTAETELESIQKDNLTTAPTSEITTKDWEKTKTTIHDKQTVSEQVLGNTTTATTRISSLATEIATSEVQSTEDNKSPTTSILSTVQVQQEDTTAVDAGKTEEGDIRPHTDSTVYEELPRFTLTTSVEISSIVTESGGMETTDSGRDETETSSSIPETVSIREESTTYSEIQSPITTNYSEVHGYVINVTAEIVPKPSITETTNAESPGQSTTTIFSARQTTARDTDEGETDTKITEVFETATDFEGNSIITAETETESTQKDNLTTVPVSSHKPTNLPRTPEIVTKDWEKTKPTIHDKQTISEDILGSTTTATTRTSSLATEITVSEFLSTEKNKSTTTSILSTGQAQPEEMTTIVAGKTEEGNIRSHTDSTAYEELPGFTLTTSAERSSIVPEQGGMETTDNGRDETETSSSVREILIIEVIKLIDEYLQEHPETVSMREESTTYSELQSPIINYSEEGGYETNVTAESVAKPSTEPTNAESVGQLTTTILSTRQTTTRDTDEGEAGQRITEVFETTTDFEGNSFITTETESTQKDNLTTALVSSQKSTNQPRTPEIATKDWEKIKTTIHDKQTISEEVLGSTTTVTTRTSPLETEITISEVQSTEENISTTTNILSTRQVQPERATTIVVGETKESDISPHNGSTVYEELPGFTLTTSTEISSIVTESGGIDITDNGRDGTESSSRIRKIEATTLEVQATNEEKFSPSLISSTKQTQLETTTTRTGLGITGTEFRSTVEEKYSPTTMPTKEQTHVAKTTVSSRQTNSEDITTKESEERKTTSQTTEAETDEVPYMTDMVANALTTELTTTEKKVNLTMEEYDISEKVMCEQNNFRSEVCNKEGFFRFNGSCTLHYECYYSKTCGKMIPSDIYECPYCLKFNAKDMKCDLPENVPECTYHKLTNTPHCNDRRLKHPMCTGPGKFGVPENNEKYYDCVDEHNNEQYHLTVKKCPKRHNFNDLTKRCEKKKDCEQRSRCGRARLSQVAGKCGEKHYAYDKFNCQKFYHCHHKKPKIPLCCPVHYVFNGDFCQSQNTTLFCNWEELKKVLYKHNKDKNKE